jgi:alcohol dehydrogenase class IV
MPYRTFIVPREIYYGPGALEALGYIPEERVFIITDPGIRSSGLVDKVEQVLKDKKATVSVFDQIEPDPSNHTVWKIFAQAQEFKPDLFIGLGGGSSIDGGKGAWTLYENPDLAELPFPQVGRELRNRQLHKKARYVAIPTTSGTGSEVTSVAVITDRDVIPNFKRAWGSRQMAPDIAIADAELVVSMPPEVTANTGFDALVHAIECYVLTEPMDMVDPIAIAAAKTVLEWLPKAVADGSDITARDKMHLAALQAGMAFSNGRLGLVHSTAHDIGAIFHVPHGRANAFMLNQVFAFVYPSRQHRLSSLATILGIDGSDNCSRTANLLDLIDSFKQEIGIPLAIKESGIDATEFEAQIDILADNYMKGMGQNIANLAPEAQRASGMPASAEEMKALYMHAWNGTRAELE